MCIQSVVAAGGLGEADDPVITSTPLVKQAIAVKANGTHTLFLFFFAQCHRFSFLSAAACSACDLLQPFISLSFLFF